MKKNIIKKHLIDKFVNEAKGDNDTPGISVTKSAQDQSAKINKSSVKDIDKNLSDYDKSLNKGMDTTKVSNKFNYNGNEEVKYHDQMEIMNGQEMIQYDRQPNKIFSDRAKEAIVGSSNMGNNPEWANVVPKQQGFTGPDFGKNLVKSIEASQNLRAKETPTSKMFGDDWEVTDDKNHKAYAFENKNNNNKPQIKESMKRLKFNKEFNGVGNALKMIPESYKIDNKIFEMTDGVENYKIRWEGSLTEGKAIVLMASDKNLVNEDMHKMKHLMGYKSQETLGTVKGKARLNENAKFTDIWKKTRQLMEMEDIENADAKEADADKAVSHATEAKKHVEGSVSTEKGTKAPAPKHGNFDDVKKKAPEATKHVEGSVSTEKGTKAPAPKTGNWDEINKKAPEATKHVTMKESVTINGITFEAINESLEESMYEGMYEEGLYEYSDEQQVPTQQAVDKMEVGGASVTDVLTKLKDTYKNPAIKTMSGTERKKLIDILDKLVNTYGQSGNQNSGKLANITNKITGMSEGMYDAPSKNYQIPDMVDDIYNMPDTSVTSGEALNNIKTLLKKLDTSDRKNFVKSHLYDDGKGRKLFRIPRKGGKDVDVPIDDKTYNELLS